MGDIVERAKKEVKNLQDQLKDMPDDLRHFSLSMRSLYAQNVGTNKCFPHDFIRDDTRADAMVYFKVILPLLTKFVASISGYFGYYEALTYDQWRGMLKYILEETTGCRQLCETLLKMHEDILVPLKERQDEAMVMVREYEDLAKETEREKQELKAAAETKRSWAIGLAFVPFVNLIVSPMLAVVANKEMADADFMGQLVQMQKAASITLGEELIPALSNFEDVIKKAAGFFSVMEQELKKFQSKSEKSHTDPKWLYYKVMNKEAKDMKSICQIFFAVLPDVKTDFLHIPAEVTDQDYVDKWVKERKKTILKSPKMVEMLSNAIAEF